MTIIIRHLGGPLSGLSQLFDDSFDEILFGRSPIADVVYPTECTSIEKEHFKLRRSKFGHYSVELLGAYFVELDVAPALNGMVVKSGSKLRLGNPTGPYFQVEVTQNEHPSVRSPAHYAPSRPLQPSAPAQPPTPLGTTWSSAPRGASRGPASSAQPAIEPTMEEILASIRQIISDDESLEAPEGEADDNIINDIARVLSSGEENASAPEAPVEAAMEELEEILDLTPELGDEQLLLTQFEADEALAVEVTESEPEQHTAREAEVPSFTAPVQWDAEHASPPANERESQLHYGAATGLRASEENLRETLRPMIRQWLDEIPEPSMSEMRRGSSKGQAKAHRPSRAGSRPAIKTPSSMATTPPIETDIVDASVFSAKNLQEGSQGQVQVFLHRPDERDIAKEMAAEADPDAYPRDYTLIGRIARGKEISVVLEGQGLEVDNQVQRVIWSGNPCKCRFQVTVPSGAAGKVFHPAVVILIDSIPVGTLRFAIRATSEMQSPRGELHSERFRHYRHAFLSYASQDRSEVLKRAQLLSNLGIGFFTDILSLKPGERWKPRVLAEIDRSDVFFLFWSSHAKASQEVSNEIRYALKRQTLSKEELPDIKPIVLEGPPPPEPPDELRHLHFNDPLIYVLAAART